jgi:hypothetical protein
MKQGLWMTCVSVLLATGCAGQKAETRAEGTTGEQSQAMAHQGESGHMESMCPIKVQGTTVEARDTADGITLAFTTTQADQVSELRKRVHHMAAMHQPSASSKSGCMCGKNASAEGTGGSGDEGCPHCSGKSKDSASCTCAHGGMKKAENEAGCAHCAAHAKADVTAKEIDRGAELVMVVKDKADLEQVRTMVRRHAEQMKSGECGRI